MTKICLALLLKCTFLPTAIRDLVFWFLEMLHFQDTLLYLEVVTYLLEKARNLMKLKLVFMIEASERVPLSEPDDIASLWEAVHGTPTRNNLLNLYLCNFGRYYSPHSSYTRLLGWYVSGLWLLSLISELSFELGLGRIDWSPIVPRDEIMMVTPFMTKVFLTYVLSPTVMFKSLGLSEAFPLLLGYERSQLRS